LITGAFWAISWQTEKTNPAYDTQGKLSAIVMEHSLPMLCLLVDHLSLNALPFVPRHLPALVFVHVCYLILNLSIALSTGLSVDRTMDWHTVSGAPPPS